MQAITDDELFNLIDRIQLSFEEEKKEEASAKSHNLRDDSEDIEDIQLQCICGSKDIIKEDNIFTCRQCSSVVDRVIECSAEWRYYGGDDNRYVDPARCGLPTNMLLPKSSLGSVVGGYIRDNKDMMCVKRLQIWNTMPYDERKLLSIFECFATSTVNQGIPSKVIHDAKVFYKQASKKKISRGDNNDGLIASCIYYSCLINKVPRSIKEIAAMFKISTITLTKGNARFQSLIPINIAASSPKDFISRFGSQLGMTMEHIKKCIKFTSFLEENEVINDNSPTSSAAGIIAYYANYHQLDISKKQIASICSVSDVTITKCFKIINKYKSAVVKVLSEI
eukprot:762478-Hanusia_phi.AAC.17